MILECGNINLIRSILELEEIDYSLTEIASIVESNNAKILSSYIISNPDSKKIEVTLKINKQDIN